MLYISGEINLESNAPWNSAENRLNSFCYLPHIVKSRCFTSPSSAQSLPSFTWPTALNPLKEDANSSSCEILCFCVPQYSFICYATSPLSDSCCHREPFKTYIKRVSSNWVLGVRLVLINRCLIKWALCIVDSMSDAIFHKWMQSSWKLLALSHRLRVWQRYKRKWVKVISYVYFKCQNQV